MKKLNLVRNVSLLSTLFAATLLSGCGNDDFVKTQFSNTESGSGYRQIPAKVDIVFVGDNTGSMNGAIDTVEAQVSGMINSMKSKYWDYRIAKSLIYQPDPINHVLVNPDFMGSTLPDGTPNPTMNILSSSMSLTSVGDFLPIVPYPSGTGDNDYTYQNAFNGIYNASPSVGVASDANKPMRRDALLAVIVISNGHDIQVDPLGHGAVNTSQLSYWANQFKSLRSSGDLVRFYPVVAHNALSGGCLNATAMIGTSYSKMVTGGYLKGKDFDLCNSASLSSVLSGIESDLDVVRQAFVHEYLVLQNQPMESSIHVYKNGVEVPKALVNGWSYEGYKTVYTITGILDTNGNIIAFNADQQTGYTIHLNGTAKMIGNDYPTVNYNRP